MVELGDFELLTTDIRKQLLLDMTKAIKLSSFNDHPMKMRFAILDVERKVRDLHITPSSKQFKMIFELLNNDLKPNYNYRTNV